jgi:hypothetical protein
VPLPDWSIGQADVDRRLKALRYRRLNFDPADLGGAGWHRDDYRQLLPAEEPGQPVPGGAWEIASRLSRSYAFADPTLVEARYDAGDPLDGRNMLLILHAVGLRFYAGVRAGGVADEERQIDGRPVRVSAWDYRTLDGHVEAGQRNYEVRKWLDTGEVDFRTHAVSRPAAMSPAVQLGFRLLARHKQVEFGRRACARMVFLTDAALRSGITEGDRTFDHRYLVVHLRDHHALLIALIELCHRMASSSPVDAERALAGRILEDAESDRRELGVVLHGFSSAPSRARTAAVRVGERIGRLKSNGTLLRRSPTTSVVELEGCQLLLESARALWAGLDHLGLGPADSAMRAQRAVQNSADADTLRLAALERAARPHVGDTGPIDTTEVAAGT